MGHTDEGHDLAAGAPPARHPSLPSNAQGLSDWTGPELPPVGQVLHQSCGHYILVPDGGAEMGEGL